MERSIHAGRVRRILRDSELIGMQPGSVPGVRSGDHERRTHGSPGFEAAWAHGDNAARHDFAYRANHVASLLSKEIVAAYYGKPAAYSYVVGCSKGGNSAVRYASRYPAEFDGILASAPVLDYQGRVSTSFSWQAQALEKDGKTLFSPADLQVLHTSVLNQCDGMDGRTDGILNDPAACKPDFATMACDRSKPSGQNCFSKAQIDALRKLYAPPADSKGRVVYPAGQTPGSELNATPWLAAMPEVPGTPLVEHGADQWLRYMAYSRQSDGSNKSAQNFDFDKDPADMEAMAKVYNATTTDLGRFDKHGGKLLITHGTADEGISLAATVDYYKRLIKASGGLATTQAFARLFQVPEWRTAPAEPATTDSTPCPHSKPGSNAERPRRRSSPNGPLRPPRVTKRFLSFPTRLSPDSAERGTLRIPTVIAR